MYHIVLYLRLNSNRSPRLSYIVFLHHAYCLRYFNCVIIRLRTQWWRMSRSTAPSRMTPKGLQLPPLKERWTGGAARLPSWMFLSREKWVAQLECCCFDENSMSAVKAALKAKCRGSSYCIFFSLLNVIERRTTLLYCFTVPTSLLCSVIWLL